MSGNFRQTILGLCESPADFVAMELRKAMKGLGTDEDALIEIICILSKDEMAKVKEAYSTCECGNCLLE